MVYQPVNQKFQKVLYRIVLAVKVIFDFVQVNLQQTVFKLAVLCGMFFNIGIVYAFLIFLFVGKMCFCIVDKFRYQMYNAVRFVLQKVVIKQFMGFLGKLK